MDIRLIRTREAIMHALFRMMAEKPWDEISVREICLNAEVSRSAFYKQFVNKDAILDAAFAQLLVGLSGGQYNRGLDKNRTLRSLKPLLSHVKSHHSILETNVATSGWSDILDQFKKVISKAVKSEIDNAQSVGKIDTLDITFLSGGVAEVIGAWIEGQFQVPETEMLRTLDSIVARHFEKFLA